MRVKTEKVRTSRIRQTKNIRNKFTKRVEKHCSYWKQTFEEHNKNHFEKSPIASISKSEEPYLPRSINVCFLLPIINRKQQKQNRKNRLWLHPASGTNIRRIKETKRRRKTIDRRT